MLDEQPQQRHEMILKSSDEKSGVDEWYCPTCGRQFLMQWPPQYKRTILVAGDEYAIHSGGKGGVKMNSEQNGQGVFDPDLRDMPSSKADFEPWIRWMEETNFEDLWKSSPQ